ncbi:MAG: PHP domain-containing protein [Clostridiales bacterium]|nr:PHP domain-containing protein [Clostridiales bacterium]
MRDLHLHTYYSDGTLSPEEVVKRAADKGIRTIAITDHDGLKGISEALNAGEKYGVKVIPGIELSAKVYKEDFTSSNFIPTRDVFMHILGYDIDINNEELNQEIENIRQKRIERNMKLLAKLNCIGCELNEGDLFKWAQKDYIGKPNFALALMEKGYIKNPKEAFLPGKFLRHPEVRSVRREKIHARKAISLIENAGGKAVLAHPMKIRALKGNEEYNFEGLEALLDILQKWGLVGMECRYSTHSKEQTEVLEKIAQKRGLVITSGSDYHGPDFDPSIDIGVFGKDY